MSVQHQPPRIEVRSINEDVGRKSLHHPISSLVSSHVDDHGDSRKKKNNNTKASHFYLESNRQNCCLELIPLAPEAALHGEQSSVSGKHFHGQSGNGASSAGYAASTRLGTELHQRGPPLRPTREPSSISELRCIDQTGNGAPSAGSTCQRGAASLTSDVAAENGFPQTNPTQADVGCRGSERRADTPRQGVSEGGRNGVTERFPGPAVAPRLLVKTSRPSVPLRSRTHVNAQPCWSGGRQPQNIQGCLVIKTGYGTTATYEFTYEFSGR